MNNFVKDNVPPLISVLMTAYNRADFIVQSIESVLASTYGDFELIIVDDCSSDSTVEIASLYTKVDSRVKVFVNNKNIGDYPNRNIAASYASGKYIKYLDSDDIIYAHGLQVMVDAMLKFPESGLGFSSIGDIERPLPVCLSPYEIYLEHFFGFGHFDRAPGSAIIKRSVFDQVGGFSGKRMIGDYELWFKLARVTSVVKFPRDLVWDRRHLFQESQSEYAKKYDELRAEVLNSALSHPECPLSHEDLVKIKQNQLKKSIKNLIKKYL